MVNKSGMSRKQCKRSRTDRFIRLINLTTLCYYNLNGSVLKEFEGLKITQEKQLQWDLFDYVEIEVVLFCDRFTFLLSFFISPFSFT